MIALFIALILAHLIGDFLLQPETWVLHKNKYKQRSKYLYAHIATHAIALLVLLQFDSKYWLGFLIILVSHLCIDLAKLYFQTKKNNRLLFALDQLLHILVIAIVVNIYEPYLFNLASYNYDSILLLAACFIGLSSMSSIIMKTVISKWNIENNKDKQDSLEHAGSYIGILERLFVFLFVVLNFWEGIGFLLAAKSIFRFGDLSRAKDRKLTEYVLIGTLISFGMAMFIGLIFNAVKAQL